MTLFNKKLGLIREGKLSENNEDKQFLKDVKTVFQIVGKSFYTGSFFKYFKTPMYRQYEDAMTNVMMYVLRVLIYCWEVIKRQKINSVRSISKFIMCTCSKVKNKTPYSRNSSKNIIKNRIIRHHQQHIYRISPFPGLLHVTDISITVEEVYKCE